MQPGLLAWAGLVGLCGGGGDALAGGVHHSLAPERSADPELCRAKVGIGAHGARNIARGDPTGEAAVHAAYGD